MTFATHANHDHNDVSLIPCANCGEEHPLSKMTQLGDNDEYFCPACINGMAVCEDCGHAVHVNNCRCIHVHDHPEDTYCVCNGCYHERYDTCTECGNHFRNDFLEEADGHLYCPECFSDNFVHCNECGEVSYLEDAVYDENTGEHLCPSCHAERHGTGILSYHSNLRPSLEFYHSPVEFPNPLYFGVELEVDEGGEDHDNAAAILDKLGPQYAHAEHDGSLSRGFEIISQPFTLKFYREVLSKRYADAMAEASSLGYKSHDTTTCGLHIHVGRAGLGKNDNERDETITKIWILMYRFRSQLVALSRRQGTQLDRWAALPSLEDLGDLSSIYEQPLPDLKLKLKQNGVSNRYKALNLTNRNTIEFRLFRGTLKHSTLTATLQLIHNLCALAMAMSGVDALTITWEQLQTLLSVDSPELKEYMAQRLDA